VVDVVPVDGVVPVAAAAPASVAVLSRGVGVDGAGRGGAELDDEFLPAKVLEYVLELCPCTLRLALQANSNNWSCQHILYNQGCPEFRGSNHHESVPLQRQIPPIYHNESYLFATRGSSPQETENLAEIAAFVK
jgi:hypothetical protein